MTVKFQSQATGDLVMLEKHAHAVLQLIGKSESGPGILQTSDMPAALSVLKNLPQDGDSAQAQAGPQDEEVLEAAADAASDASQQGQDGIRERPEPAFINEVVSLRKRAWPLVMMIERALKEDKPIVWNVTY